MTIYALLVGIDHYPAPVPPLRGCVNDIDAMADYLRARVKQTHSSPPNADEHSTPAHTLNLQTLTNENATREAIIQGFRQHLGQAQSDDTVLFYYSGHGSQEQAPEEFWPLEPDRLNETLVCWDSRLDGHWDLADKELATLIGEVSQTNPHIIIILDCCHSGAGTRNPLQAHTVRRVPTDQRDRPLNTFICSPETLQSSGNRPSSESPLSPSNFRSSSNVLSPLQNPSGWTFPRGQHILMAACRDNEEAREFTEGGQHRGMFSYFLLETLQKASTNLTYRDAFKRTNAIVRSRSTAQSPQLEATLSGDLDQFFLGGAIANSPSYFTVTHHPQKGWNIDGGAVHGLKPPSGNETTHLVLFPFDSPTEQLGQREGAIATAHITTVLPQLSTLKITTGHEHWRDTSLSFKAVVTSVPLPAFTVPLEGDAEGITLIRQALSTATMDGQPSLYLRETPTSEPGTFRLIAQNNHIVIMRSGDDGPLVPPLIHYTEQTAIAAIRYLEHIARWMTVVELESLANSRIPAQALQLEFYSGEGTLEHCHLLNQDQIRLAYVYDTVQGRWRQPTFRVKLTNTSQDNLFCAVYDLTERFKVQSILEGGVVQLEPNQEIWLNGGQPLYGNVPEEYWQDGITEYQDIFKAIACTTEFDPFLLEQHELGHLPRSSTRSATRGIGTLNRLMRRVVTRDISARPETEEQYDDWMTTQVTFTFVRPQETGTINPDHDLVLTAETTVHPHPSLSAKARLTTTRQSTRDLGNHILPALFRDHPTQSKPFQFTNSRGTDPGLSALELSNINNPQLVTPSQSLKITVDTPLDANEYVLPIAYDPPVLNDDGTVTRDGFFLPLGYGSFQDGSTEITLERLPNPTSEGSRSVGGSIRIFFQKVMAEKLGLEFSYPQLSVVTLTDTGTVQYETESQIVRKKVAKAQTILLYIHGFVGDTESMVSSAQHTQIAINGQNQSLADCYDLILAFDYENLNTPMGNVAEQLKNKLAAVGLGPNHSQVLHVIAHSMGGLVCRSFIEQKGGNQVIQHLIMAGTPNAGSPWATVQDWATTALTIGINSLSTVAFPIKMVGNLVAAIELLDISLDQMRPGAEFLKSLQDCPDPHVPYTIIAGNSSMIQPHTPSAQNRLLAILEAVGRNAVEFPFMGQPNDIAATVYSINQVPEGRSPQPQFLNVSCNHLVYFTHPDGLQTLAQAIISTGILEKLLISKDDSSKPNTPIPLRPDTDHSQTFPLWLIGLIVIVVTGAIAGIWIWNQQSKQQNKQSISITQLICSKHPNAITDRS